MTPAGRPEKAAAISSVVDCRCVGRTGDPTLADETGKGGGHRRLDEMQNPMEERITGLGGPANVDDAGVRKLVGEYVKDSLPSFVIERSQHVVDEQPAGCL